MKPSNFIVSTEKEIKFIENALKIFNEKNGPFPTDESPKPLNFFIEDDEKNIVAGINAIFYRFIAYVDVLWVDEFYRKQGLGKSLYLKVETEAKKLKAKLIHLETLEFQAKDFYIKLGFEVYGVLENFPPGHTKYSLSKNL